MSSAKEAVTETILNSLGWDDFPLGLADDLLTGATITRIQRVGEPSTVGIYMYVRTKSGKDMVLDIGGSSQEYADDFRAYYAYIPDGEEETVSSAEASYIRNFVLNDGIGKGMTEEEAAYIRNYVLNDGTGKDTTGELCPCGLPRPKCRRWS